VSRSAPERAKRELARARDVRLAPLGAVVAGIAITAIALVAKALVRESVGDPGYIVLLAAVIAASWVGGTVAGVVTVAGTFVLDGLLFVDPVGELLAVERTELARQAIYLLVAAGSVVLIGSRRASRDRLADALAEAASLTEAVVSRDARLELVLEASGTGFWEWDMVTGELTWTDEIYRQHGLDPALPAPGFETYLGTIDPVDVGRFREAIEATIEHGTPFDIEFRVRWPDGSVHWTRGSGRVFRDRGGRPVRMIGTGQDITERRRLEEERDRLLAEERRAREFREAFVDVISHELRTPITTILGLAQILARPGRQDDPASRIALLDDVRAESERLHRLVEDLLVLSRVERGRLDVETEPLEPRRLIERIVAAEAAELPTIDIRLEVDPVLPIVAGDATYVEQIVRNLLGNAAKYTPKGTSVVVSARPEEKGVAFRVSDEGPGIPDDSLERVFELFYRDPESARMVSGSGIGLFVCASLAEAMGGRIWARRRPEGGTEIGFLLRALEPDEDLPPPLPGSARAEAEAGGPTPTGAEAGDAGR
jgi:K+-sensing histidine kinase KdpD